MNYIILNDYELFQDINLNNFKEVSLNGQERIDAVFCHITKKILENIDNDPTRRDQILPEAWLLGNPGIFVLSKIDRNILYDENTELIKTLFGLFDQEKFFVEIRGYNRPQSYNQIEQYIIAYNKNLGFVENLFPENIETENILEILLQNIEKKLL